jgi:hypothetical protein
LLPATLEPASENVPEILHLGLVELAAERREDAEQLLEVLVEKSRDGRQRYLALRVDARWQLAQDGLPEYRRMTLAR